MRQQFSPTNEPHEFFASCMTSIRISIRKKLAFTRQEHRVFGQWRVGPAIGGREELLLRLCELPLVVERLTFGERSPRKRFVGPLPHETLAAIQQCFGWRRRRVAAVLRFDIRDLSDFGVGRNDPCALVGVEAGIARHLPPLPWNIPRDVPVFRPPAALAFGQGQRSRRSHR